MIAILRLLFRKPAQPQSVGDVVSSIETDLDKLLADANASVARARERAPKSFDSCRCRRAGDRREPKP